MTSLAIPKAGPRRMRVLVADDSPAILEDVVDVLEAQFDVVSAVSSGAAVLASAERNESDLLVLDISLGDMSGIEVASRVRELGYVGKIVFLTVHEDEEFVAAALAAGGQGYVIKSRLASELIDAIVVARAGGIFVSAGLSSQVGRSRF